METLIAAMQNFLMAKDRHDADYYYAAMLDLMEEHGAPHQVTLVEELRKPVVGYDIKDAGHPIILAHDHPDDTRVAILRRQTKLRCQRDVMVRTSFATSRGEAFRALADKDSPVCVWCLGGEAPACTKCVRAFNNSTESKRWRAQR